MMLYRQQRSFQLCREGFSGDRRAVRRATRLRAAARVHSGACVVSLVGTAPAGARLKMRVEERSEVPLKRSSVSHSGSTGSPRLIRT